MREPWRVLPTGEAASNSSRVISGSWVGSGDQVHSDGAVALPGAAAPAGVAAPVPDHVAGVLGVAEELPHGRTGPVPDGPGRVDGFGWRVGGGVGVEAVGDGVVGQPVDGAQVEDPGDHRAAGRVGDEAVFGAALGAAGGDGVGDLVGEVPVRWFADVPALDGVLDEAIPGQLQHVQDVPLGDGLLDPAGQYRVGFLRPAGGGAAEAGDQVGVDALVDSEQRHLGLFQFPFDAGADAGDPGDPVDRLADHGDEPPVGAVGFGE